MDIAVRGIIVASDFDPAMPGPNKTKGEF